jgi:protein TonB
MLNATSFRIRPLSKFSEFSSNLTERDFYVMIGAAIMLHVLGFIVYQLLPHEEIVPIPVKSLNIKLGGGQGVLRAEKMQASAPPKRYAPSQSQAAPVSEQAQSIFDQALANPTDAVRSDAAKQKRASRPRAAGSYPYAESEGADAPAGAGSPYGEEDATGTEETLRRYEQILSLWIERHRIYPPDLRAQGMQGEAIVRIRINRRGRILAVRLERATRYDALNDAVEDMVRAASPVPAVPANYPPGEQFEFLIPMRFKLQ